MAGCGRSAAAVLAACFLLLAATDGASVPDGKCSLAPDAGPCEAAIQRYYYDANDDTCKQFYYGGCKGNGNNFETPEACQAACGKSIDVCSLEKETGLCKAAIPRYYYDAQSKRCKRFIYGGCGGNGNNFETRGECRRTCAKRGPSRRSCRKRCCDGTAPPECQPICDLVRCPAPPPACTSTCCTPRPLDPLDPCVHTCPSIQCPGPPIVCTDAQCCHPGGASAGCEAACALVDCPPPPPDCGAQCCSNAGPISKECQATCALVDCPPPPVDCVHHCCWLSGPIPKECEQECEEIDCAPPPVDCASACCDGSPGGPPAECLDTCARILCPFPPLPPPPDCATKCCDAVAGGYEPPPECVDTCNVVNCAAPPEICKKACCDAAAGGYGPPVECLGVCAAVRCPALGECPDMKLCCEATRPAACEGLCKMVRMDCSCTAEDCCPSVTRKSCQETCNTVDCAPLCTPQDCCSGVDFCDPAGCAAVACPSEPGIAAPYTPLPADCRSYDCCSGGDNDGECEDFCESVDCSLGCCPPVERPGSQPCRDCGFRG